MSFNKLNPKVNGGISEENADAVNERLDNIEASADNALPASDFSDEMVTAKVLTGLEAGPLEAITETDTILEALAKLQAQIDFLN